MELAVCHGHHASSVDQLQAHPRQVAHGIDRVAEDYDGNVHGTRDGEKDKRNHWTGQYGGQESLEQSSDQDLNQRIREYDRSEKETF